MRKTVELNAFDSVASGALSSLFIRQAYAYHELLLKLTNVTAAQIEYLALYLDSKEVQRWTGTDLDKMNQYKGLAAAAGAILKLPLTRVGLLERSAEYATEIHLGVPDKQGYTPSVMRLEVKLATGLTNPGISAKAVVDNAVPGNLGQLLFVKKSNFDVQGTERVLNTIVNPKDRQVMALDQLILVTANTTELEVQVDGAQAFKRTAAENTRQQSDGVRTPQSGYFVFDTGENGFGQIADALDVFNAREVQFRVKTSAAETIGTYVQSIGFLS